MSKKSNVMTMLGFARKSGEVISGEAAVKAVLKKGQVYLLIMAEDLSENRKKYWSYLANEVEIPIFVIGNKKELGISIGLSPRSIIGVTDADMAKSMVKMI